MGPQHSFAYFPEIPKNFSLDHSCVSYEGNDCPRSICGGGYGITLTGIQPNRPKRFPVTETVV